MIRDTFTANPGLLADPAVMDAALGGASFIRCWRRIPWWSWWFFGQPYKQ